MSGRPGNGQFDAADDDEMDDDSPLAVDEQAAAEAAAQAEADESLDERVEAVIEDLDGVERRRDGESVTYLVHGRPFAVLLPDVLEVALEATVAKAALRTADTHASSRGPGWIAFAPRAVDRFALDRAEAWLRSAYRRLPGG